LLLGSWTSTGFFIVQGNAVSGRETITLAGGDQFVLTFTGTLQRDGSIRGTFTLGAGTGRFSHIHGVGVLSIAPSSDGTHYEMDLLGAMLLAGQD
jgi:hypothetical protein